MCCRSAIHRFLLVGRDCVGICIGGVVVVVVLMVWYCWWLWHSGGGDGDGCCKGGSRNW